MSGTDHPPGCGRGPGGGAPERSLGDLACAFSAILAALVPEEPRGVVPEKASLPACPLSLDDAPSWGEAEADSGAEKEPGGRQWRGRREVGGLLAPSGELAGHRAGGESG